MTSTCQDPVHVFIDNTNVFMQGKQLVSSIEKVSDIDYDKLLKIILGGRETAQKPIIVGSYWPRNRKSENPFWKKLETNGFDIKLYENKNYKKEKLVDTTITTRITASVYTKKTSTIILVAGDGDYKPPLSEAKKNGWDVEVWFWENGLAQSLKCIATKVGYLKPEHVTIDLPPSPRIISDYAQQIFSGIPPTYERNDQDLPTYEDQKASMVSGIKNPFN